MLSEPDEIPLDLSIPGKRNLDVGPPRRNLFSKTHPLDLRGPGKQIGANPGQNSSSSFNASLQSGSATIASTYSEPIMVSSGWHSTSTFNTPLQSAASEQIGTNPGQNSSSSFNASLQSGSATIASTYSVPIMVSSGWHSTSTFNAPLQSATSEQIGTNPGQNSSSSFNASLQSGSATIASTYSEPIMVSSGWHSTSTFNTPLQSAASEQIGTNPGQNSSSSFNASLQSGSATIASTCSQVANEQIGTSPDSGNINDVNESVSIRQAPGKGEHCYSEEDVQAALEHIRTGIMSLYRASITFNVPRGTLQYRMSDRFQNKLTTGPPTVLTTAEEESLVQWLFDMQRKGFPVTSTGLQIKVADFIKVSPRPNTFKNGIPGLSWLAGFMRRHPELAVRKPEGVTAASARVSEDDIRGWYRTIWDYGETHPEIREALMDPKRKVNGDEIGFYLFRLAKKVLAKKGSRDVMMVESGDPKKNVTVLFCFSADGYCFPPDIVLSYKRLPKDIIQSVPGTWGIGKSANGWMDTENFVLYIKRILYPSLVRRGVKFPVLFFVDGHKSHTAFAAAEACQELGIVLIALYPNSTRMLQPCDVGVFGPLKGSWRTIVELRPPNDPVTTLNFAATLEAAMNASLKEETIKKAFVVTGIHPFDENAPNYSKCLAKSASKTAAHNQRITSPACPLGTASAFSVQGATSAARPLDTVTSPACPLGTASTFSVQGATSATRPLDTVTSPACPLGTASTFSVQGATSAARPLDTVTPIRLTPGVRFSSFADDLNITSASINTTVSANRSAVGSGFSSFVDDLNITSASINTTVSANRSAVGAGFSSFVDDLNITSASMNTTVSASRSAVGGGFSSFVDDLNITSASMNTTSPRPLGTAPFYHATVGDGFSTCRGGTNAATTSTLLQSTGVRCDILEDETRTEEPGLPPLRDVTNKRRMSISDFLQTPPTPKRKSKHINYKIRTQPILTADERLAELRHADELKVQKKLEQQEKAKAREEAKLAKQAEKEVREAERKRKREEKASWKELQERLKQRKAEEKQEKEAAKKKAAGAPSDIYVKLR